MAHFHFPWESEILALPFPVVEWFLFDENVGVEPASPFSSIAKLRKSNFTSEERLQGLSYLHDNGIYPREIEKCTEEGKQYLTSFRIVFQPFYQVQFSVHHNDESQEYVFWGHPPYLTRLIEKEGALFISPALHIDSFLESVLPHVASSKKRPGEVYVADEHITNLAFSLWEHFRENKTEGIPLEAFHEGMRTILVRDFPVNELIDMMEKIGILTRHEEKIFFTPHFSSIVKSVLSGYAVRLTFLVFSGRETENGEAEILYGDNLVWYGHEGQTFFMQRFKAHEFFNEEELAQLDESYYDVDLIGFRELPRVECERILRQLFLPEEIF